MTDPKVFPIAAAILSLPRTQFASFEYVGKESGEVARHTVILGGSTELMYEKDIVALEALDRDPSKLGELTAKYAPLAPFFREAVTAILESRRKSLAEGIGQREDYTNRDTYTVIGNGLKIHRVSGDLHVTGLSHRKVIHQPGTYKTVNSRPLTIAKARISEAFLPSAKFRQFALSNIGFAKVNGETLELG